MQRPLNSTYDAKIGRDPRREKTIVEAAPSWGAKRRTIGEIGFHGGVAVDDLPNVGLKSYEKPIPIHSGMTSAQRDEVHPYANSAKEILTDAQHLGKRKRPAPAEKA